MLVLEIKPATAIELEILYEGVLENKKATMLMWFIVPSVGHYRWLQGPMLQVEAKHKAKFFTRIMHRVLKFLKL